MLSVPAFKPSSLHVFTISNLSFALVFPAEMSHITTQNKRPPNRLPSLNCFIWGNVRLSNESVLSEWLGPLHYVHNANYIILTVEFIYLHRDQNLMTWTDSAIYIFTPQNGQVLLWTEVKGLLLSPKNTSEILFVDK